MDGALTGTRPLCSRAPTGTHTLCSQVPTATHTLCSHKLALNSTVLSTQNASNSVDELALLQDSDRNDDSAARLKHNFKKCQLKRDEKEQNDLTIRNISTVNTCNNISVVMQPDLEINDDDKLSHLREFSDMIDDISIEYSNQQTNIHAGNHKKCISDKLNMTWTSTEDSISTEFTFDKLKSKRKSSESEDSSNDYSSDATDAIDDVDSSTYEEDVLLPSRKMSFTLKRNTKLQCGLVSVLHTFILSNSYGGTKPFFVVTL